MSGDSSRRSWLRRFLAWIGAGSGPEKKRLRRARRDLDRLFAERRDLLRSTSLRPEHRARTQVLDVADDPYHIWFGIVRHPRPYPFSRQVHEVLEVWCYLVEEAHLERVEGRNLSRARGEDGEPSTHGGPV